MLLRNRKSSQNRYQKTRLELDFEMKRLGNKILELKNIDKSFVNCC
jgi:ATP-binding cassette subfamily F protein uup